MKQKALPLLLALAILLTACAGTPTGTTAPPTTEAPVTAPSAVRVPATMPTEFVPPTTVPPETEPLGSLDNPYLPGMYKVGVDVPAGEYIFLCIDATWDAYVCVSADSNQDDILENENFANTYIVTVSDGQYLDASRCCFIVAADVFQKPREDGSYSDGMYRVGLDIPAGEYRATAAGDYAYWCIYDSSVVPLDIASNDLFDGSTYITVREGQYLQLSRCTITPVE